jgi:FkbM family methyltransferase
MKIRVVWADWVGADIRTCGYYEPEVVRLMEQVVKPGMEFVDIGAHVGQYTLLTAGLGASVHSFEPNPQTFQLLQYNVQANALTNVRLNQVALADVSKVATIQAGPADNIGTCSLGIVRNSKNHFVVQCQSLDSYIEENRITDVHVIKIDVEGSELHVLRGAQGVLSRSKPQIIIEFEERNQCRFGFSCSQLGQFLTDLGYELFQITDSGLLSYKFPKGDAAFPNVLARPKRKSSYVG